MVNLYIGTQVARIDLNKIFRPKNGISATLLVRITLRINSGGCAKLRIFSSGARNFFTPRARARIYNQLGRGAK